MYARAKSAVREKKSPPSPPFVGIGLRYPCTKMYKNAKDQRVTSAKKALQRKVAEKRACTRMYMYSKIDDSTI